MLSPRCWRQRLSASASVGVGVRVGVRVSTMFKFSKVSIVFFNFLRYCFHVRPTPTLW